MEEFNRKAHWENIYSTKALTEVSWYQPNPKESLALIEKYAPNKDVSIIDIGGGDSFLVDYLIDLGYSNISVLDISAQAIERAKNRLGDKCNQVKWIVSDVTSFTPNETYAIWHDRAAFHFLNTENDINNYTNICTNFIQPKGCLILGTFAIDGPLKCSGIEITQYDELKMKATFSTFNLVEAFQMKHPTPFETEQLFQFGVFQK